MDIKGTLKKATNIFQRDADVYDKCLMESEKHSLCKLYCSIQRDWGGGGGGGGVGRSREQTSDNHNRNEKPRSKLLCPLTKSKPNNPKEFKEHPPIQPSHCLWLLRKEPLFPRLPLLSLIIFLWARAGAPYLPSNKTVEWFIRFSAT